MPAFIADVLQSGVFLLVSRIVLTAFFWASAILLIVNFGKSAAAMQEIGVPMPTLMASMTITTQLIGSFLVITNAYGLGWLGAGGLGAFTLLTIPVAHPFWKFEQPKRTEELDIVLEHITVVGGFMLAAVLSLR